MCMSCWIDYGAPLKRTPRVLAMAERLIAFDEIEPVGGHLHIVLDDWNLDRDSVRYCERQAKRGSPWQGPDAAQARLARDLRQMTLRDRASALAIRDGYEPAHRAYA